MTAILNNFEATSLSEMDNVKLMNRIDTKYILHKNKLSLLLDLIISNYKVLEINGQRIMAYRNNYFDTNNFSLYKAHHNGKLNRYKVRIREYVESKTKFTEIKFKNNKKKTKKKRILTNEHTAEENSNFLKQNSPFYFKDLENKIDIDFQRFTLVHKTQNERATIDLNLKFSKKSAEYNLLNTVIVEIKQESYRSDSDLIKALKLLRIRPQRMSKYCIGVALLNENLKRNNFKAKIQKIQKIEKLQPKVQGA